MRGLDWGLPWALHIDERLFIVAKSIQLEARLAEGAMPDPGITSYGILPLWLLVAARKLFLGVATGSGPPTHGDAFAGTVWLARWISAIWGVATIAAVAAWGRRWGGGTALAAAALVAGFPALVQIAHFGTVEAPLTALLVLGLLAAERLAERPSAARAAVGGLLLGLAVSVKAPGAVLAFPLLHAARGPGWARRVAIGVGVALVLWIALNPALLFGSGSGGPEGEHTTLLGNLRRAYSSEFHDWTLPYANDVPVWTDLTGVLPWAMGWLPEIAALVGLALVLRRRSGPDTRLLLVLVPLLLIVLPARVKTVRFLVPALPALAILAAEAARSLGRRVPSLRLAAPAVLALFALLHGAAFSSVYAGPDPRVAAARWLDENAGPRVTIAVEDPPGYGPPLGSPSSELVRPRHRWEILWRGFYSIHEKRDAAERRKHLDHILDRADLLVLSEGHRVEFTTVPELRPVESTFYADLDAGRLPFEKEIEFANPPRLGPIVLDDRGAEVLMRVFDHPRIEIWRKTKETE